MKYIAYYLGQYHPIPENSEYWGEGFTEWHNVSRARPLFPGHEQPVLPGRLGFYDLRSNDVIVNQLDYAREIGIDAFCYWHYWFSGKRVLSRPLDNMLSLPDRGIKIMLGWANESWTGAWHGLSNQIILHQKYDRNELKEHAKLLAGYIKTDRYLKLEDTSPFLIYKPRNIPDAKNYLDEFRDWVSKFGGGELYIIGNWGPGQYEQVSYPSELGLDAVVVTPVGRLFKSNMARITYLTLLSAARRIRLGPEIRSYRAMKATLLEARKSIGGVAHSTIVTGWDNTPRSGRRGLVLTGYNEKSLSELAVHAIETEKQNKKNRLVFIKSWNEWAEGNVLEPKYKEKWSAADILKGILSD